LRRLAGALRALSADERAATTERFPASGPPDPTVAAPQPIAGRAAHVGALRRSRELLDALQRTLAQRHYRPKDKNIDAADSLSVNSNSR